MPVVCRVGRWAVRIDSTEDRDRLLRGASEPKKTTVQGLVLDLSIESTDSGFLLFSEVVDGPPQIIDSRPAVADTWHESVEDAKRQANLEFGVPPEKWVATRSA